MVVVLADPEDKTAKVVVPDYQLSLAIGKEGQNARLAARLTGFKIDIKSESQANAIEDFYEGFYDDEDEEEAYDSEYEGGEAYEDPKEYEDEESYEELEACDSDADEEDLDAEVYEEDGVMAPEGDGSVAEQEVTEWEQ